MRNINSDRQVPLFIGSRLDIPLILVVNIVVGFGMAGSANSFSHKPVELANLMEAHSALRDAIRTRFEQLVASGTLKSGYLDNNDVSDVFLEFIKPGIKFDVAKKILSNAGLEVTDPPVGEVTGNRPGKYDLIGSINPYKQLDIGRISLFVAIRPESEIKRDVVGGIAAGFIVSLP